LSKSGFLGPTVLAATMSVQRTYKSAGKEPTSWQYHPRSDHHSKVSCLLMGLDLLLESETLRKHVEDGRVACGINHVMTDYKSKRRKAFDLVIHRISEKKPASPRRTFKSLLSEYGVVLTADQQSVVSGLPDVPVHTVDANDVYVAFEAKACMTAFGKARPRLFDELNSSHPTIHGDKEEAIAAGFVLINSADSFISPIINRTGANGPNLEVTKHKQPTDYQSVVQKVRELPLRSYTKEFGFDAVGIVLMHCANDGTPVAVVDDPPTLRDYEYDRMIKRVASLYEARFKA